MSRGGEAQLWLVAVVQHGFESRVAHIAGAPHSLHRCRLVGWVGRGQSPSIKLNRGKRILNSGVREHRTKCRYYVVHLKKPASVWLANKGSVTVVEWSAVGGWWEPVVDGHWSVVGGRWALGSGYWAMGGLRWVVNGAKPSCPTNPHSYLDGRRLFGI